MIEIKLLKNFNFLNELYSGVAKIYDFIFFYLKYFFFIIIYFYLFILYISYLSFFGIFLKEMLLLPEKTRKEKTPKDKCSKPVVFLEELATLLPIG
jgi:hypothetical protein